MSRRRIARDYGLDDRQMVRKVEFDILVTISKINDSFRGQLANLESNIRKRND